MSAPDTARHLVALVADGSPYGARTTRDVLARTGVRRIVEVLDGAEALSALADHKPDLLVLDWQLPVITAREIVAMARDASRSHAPAMPVIVTMPEPTARAVSEAMALEVDAILARPFSPKDLRLRLERIVRARASTGAARPNG
ncbi:PleD family two-component system response regulator [uncultured Enterovirga sp.]|uniref:response regulator n=1 Tax=uncultured Enterovirga sp. TaxID=2026352 RepID=UPI0035CBC95C